MDIARSFVGIAAFIFIAWALSENRKHNSWKMIFSALRLQIALAILILKVPVVATFTGSVSQVFTSMVDFVNDGAVSVFGKLNTDARDLGTIIGFRVLLSVLFLSALTSV